MFQLENDMENYIRYKVMGSVKRIQMKPGCIPSKFDCQANASEGNSNKPTPSSSTLYKQAKLFILT